MLVTAERDGYFSIFPLPSPDLGENKVEAREQPRQIAAWKSSRSNKKSTVLRTTNDQNVRVARRNSVAVQ